MQRTLQKRTLRKLTTNQAAIKIIMSNIFFQSLLVAISKQDSLSLVLCGMKKALAFSACYSRAEKIPTGGNMYACMDGVSLYLEKNFNKMI